MPIGAGYFAVSLAIGLYWAKGGLPPLASAVFSATSMSSTSQFAGITIIVGHGALLELAATTLIVNLRYLLMSVSLAQRLDRRVSIPARLLIAAGVTDEIYALNVSRRRPTARYFVGSMLAPVAGWSGGTLTGAYLGEVIPAAVQSAAGILLFAMFVAIVVPPAKGSAYIRIVVVIAGAVSVALAFLPGVRDLEAGWRIIIATCVAAGIGASVLPVAEPGAPGQGAAP